MKKRPWTLKVLIFSFLAFAITPYLKGPFRFELNPYEVITFESLALYSIICIWRTSRWIFYSLPIAVALMGYEAYSSVQYAQLINFLMASFFLGSQLFWFVGSTWKSVLNPQLRWWQTPKRMTLAAPGEVRTLLGLSANAKVINLSRNGVLLEVDSQTPIEKVFESGKLIDLRFRLNPLSVVQCRTKVVRLEKREGHYRFGLKIDQIKTQSRLRLENYLKVQAIT